MSGNNKKIYILGSTGFLGGACADYLSKKGYFVVTNRVDVVEYGLLRNKFKVVRPDVVINFAGIRAYPTIDWCEDHKEETVRVNVGGAINVMLAAIECGAYPIQISSGCVYSGGPEHAFTEDDEPNFYGSFYSRMRIVLQKTLAELPVLYTRIRMPMSSTSHARNFIDKIASYQKVISIPNSVTLIEDLWPTLERLIQIRATGILNLTNEGFVEHDEVLNAYKQFVNPDHTYQRISLEDLEGPEGITKAKRSNCVLSMDKAKSLGISMPPLTEKKLKEIMVRYKSSLQANQLVS